MSRAQLTSTVEQNTGGAVSPYVAGKNFVYNSSGDIWQRGTSVTVNGAQAYTADRWNSWTTGGGGQSVTSQQAGTNGSRNAIRFGRTAGNTNTEYWSIQQSLETTESMLLAGKTVTMSFYVRAGSGYSGAGAVLNSRINYTTGTDASPVTVISGTNVVTGSHTITTSWQKFSITGTINSAATSVGFGFYYGATGSPAPANDYFEFTQVQLEVGSVATSYTYRGGTLSGELAACQRYYYRMGGTAAYTMIGMGSGTSTTSGRFLFTYPVTMRTTPTGLEFSTLAFGDFTTSALAVTTGAFDAASPTGMTVNFNTSGTSVQYRPYALFTNNSTSGYLGFSAEL